MMSIQDLGFTRAESTLFLQEHQAIQFLLNSNAVEITESDTSSTIVGHQSVGLLGKIWMIDSGNLQVLIIIKDYPSELFSLIYAHSLDVK